MIGEQRGITPSGLVYLFGEQFVEPARTMGETLLASGVKVRARELSEMLYGVALLALDADGIVRLELAQRKLFLGLAKARTVTIRPLGRQAAGGLEAAILAMLAPDPARNNVADVLRRHIGQDMADPWGEIVSLVKADLAARGLLLKTRQVRRGVGRIPGDRVTITPVPERIAALGDLVGPVRGLLANARARQPQLVDLLWREMRRGFQSRVEQQDSDAGD